ncbi:hypothetical protein EWM64_g7113 [Hericium alpestre]|uniref:NmrA-like domain-containing protein n=1 Tax=Hericium alpestre TaxID=135208 RepID=A0A4Y9ZS83_9AGAM|nr:hypothetical protein EWM64_g7113 [Hericium alpestre]
MTILIAPGTSRTATYVIRALLATPSPPPLRLLAHSESSKTSLESTYADALAEVTVTTADFLDPASLQAAMSGASTVFYNGPMSGNDVRMGKNAVDAAKAAGVQAFVFCSVLHPYISRMIHHRSKLEVEEYLFESGLKYTILQPTHMMQNVKVKDVLKSGQISIPWKPEVLHGFLDLYDLGAATASILRSPADHAYARYELISVNGTYHDVAKAFTACAGKEVKCMQVEPEVALKPFEARGMIRDLWVRDALGRMFAYYNEHGLPGSPNILRWLLGREPSTWPDMIRLEGAQ